MAKEDKTPTELLQIVTTELRNTAGCQEAEVVAIDVNWDRPPGWANWWVTHISKGRAGISECGLTLRQILPGLQLRYVAASDEGFHLGRN